MLNDIGHCLESSLILVASGNGMTFGVGTVLLLRHEDGNLGAQFRQFERTCLIVSRFCLCILSLSLAEYLGRIQAMTVMMEPAVAPAAPKQLTDQKLG